jgi:hypothetical protein
MLLLLLLLHPHLTPISDHCWAAGKEQQGKEQQE